MSMRHSSIQTLLAKARFQVERIEARYNNALLLKVIDPELKVDIKNACENLRSALDYLAADI